jgi:lysophospholipase
MEGVVLQTYGSGNVPETLSCLFEELKSACDRGVVVVNCSQCSNGGVAGIYPGGIVSSCLCVVGVY